MIEIRRLGPDDWRQWRAVRRAALAEAPEAFGSTLAEWSGVGDTERRWRARLASAALNLVLYRDGDPVAMVSALVPDERSVVELISMWVAPAARGQGLGDRAISEVVAWADVEHPDRTIELNVAVGNDRAMRLYRRHGFADVGPSPEDGCERLMRRVSTTRSD